MSRNKVKFLKSLFISEKTRDFLSKISFGTGTLLKNNKEGKEYIGWGRLEDGRIFYLEGDLKINDKGKFILPFTITIVPEKIIENENTIQVKIPDIDKF